MTRAELIALASPPCRDCGSPVERVEQSWQRNGDGDWVPGPAHTVCGNGHRVVVELLDGR